MILADKIIEERKKLGFSQEELAEKLSVSRQAVSKWESAQSIPDLQKIIAMSQLFSVSTDYLLKDDAPAQVEIPVGDDAEQTLCRVSMEEANEFISTIETQSKTLALGVLLCILCPVMLIFLSGLAEAHIAGITETISSVIGLALLFILVAIAVFLFIQNKSRTEKFDYLEKEPFETAYGVSGLVKEKKEAYEPIYTRHLALGVILCMLSPLPLIITALINESDVLLISMTALLMCIVAVGVYMIVRVVTVRESFQILLQEGDYSKNKKKNSSAVNAASGGYWCLVTAIYLAWSFITDDWKSTWIVWPIAGILCAPFILVIKQICEAKGRRKP